MLGPAHDGFRSISRRQNSKYDLLRSCFSRRIFRFRSRLDLSHTTVSYTHLLSADLSALNDENQTNAAKIEELQDQLETAEQTIASMADSDSTEELQSQIDALQSENTKLTEENEKLAAQSASASNSSKSSPDATVSSGADAPSQPADTDSQIVLVTKTGSKYHNHKCGNGTYYEATLEDALARGLTPCKKCF